ncbi:hypothetical protein [Nitrogeniibacter aestuarii]|uniref:hypothetical protein n=1 Tax=Nitrogeniibacter aestuarii TaxID=2815343 RepID=UPI001E3EEEBA|nr:hypothetical protein [Nitrogeniibacter aestuarii]
MHHEQDRASTPCAQAMGFLSAAQSHLTVRVQSRWLMVAQAEATDQCAQALIDKIREQLEDGSPVIDLTNDTSLKISAETYSIDDYTRALAQRHDALRMIQPTLVELRRLGFAIQADFPLDPFG